MSDPDVVIATVMGMVEDELRSAMRRFPAMHSPHEGIAVIREEYLELEREVFENRGSEESAMAEATQGAAMFARYLVDLAVWPS